MQPVCWKVQIKTYSPVNIGSGTQSKSEKMGYTVKRNVISSTGKIKRETFIPGTTIKGTLKQNYRLLMTDKHQEQKECCCSMCRLFGRPGYYPAKIYIDDFLLAGEESIQVRSGNQIDRKRRICVEGALFSKEVVYGVYEGEITAYIESDEMKQLLMAAINMTKEIGGGKSRGLGNVQVIINKDGEVHTDES